MRGEVEELSSRRAATHEEVESCLQRIKHTEKELQVDFLHMADLCTQESIPLALAFSSLQDDSLVIASQL